MFRPVFCWTLAALSATAGAQEPPQGAPPSLPYRSAFEGYRPFSEQPVASWKEANDNVGRIGGWRAYAREAAGEPSPAAPPQSAVNPSPQASPSGPSPARPTSPAPHRGHQH